MQTVTLTGCRSSRFSEYRDALASIYTTFELAFPPNTLRPWKAQANRLQINNRIFTDDEDGSYCSYAIPMSPSLDPRGVAEEIMAKYSLVYLQENEVSYLRKVVLEGVPR
jgi:hypothetical protein